jgi:hypothetical protein
MKIEFHGFEALLDKVEAINTKIDLLSSIPTNMWLNNEQFIETIGVSRKTAQQYRDKGLIQFSQIGAKIYYKLSEVNKFLERHSITPAKVRGQEYKKGARS